MTFKTTKKIILADGRAILYRGDSIELLKAGLLKCDAIVSDPPYGIGYQHSGNTTGNVLSSTATIFGDDQPFDPAPWIDLVPKSRFQSKGELKKAGGEPLIVLFGADSFRARIPECGTLLAWDKHVGNGPDDSFSDCEWAWCGRKVKREVFRHLWKGAISSRQREDNCPTFPPKNGSKSQRAHVAQKPVALMRWCIQKLKPPINGVILDPYAGSGTTGIAALSLGYRFIGVEIEENHFKTACARIEDFWKKHGSDQSPDAR